MFRVIIAGPAQKDIRSAFSWWAAHRSATSASRWYVGIVDAIYSLKSSPDRCTLAPERDLVEQPLRQLLFGLGSRPTHRIVFVVDGSDVIILAVRHAGQDLLLSDDLEQ